MLLIFVRQDVSLRSENKDLQFIFMLKKKQARNCSITRKLPWVNCCHADVAWPVTGRHLNCNWRTFDEEEMTPLIRLSTDHLSFLLGRCTEYLNWKNADLGSYRIDDSCVLFGFIRYVAYTDFQQHGREISLNVTSRLVISWRMLLPYFTSHHLLQQFLFLSRQLLAIEIIFILTLPKNWLEIVKKSRRLK